MNSLRKILIGCLALVSVGCSQVAATNAPETAVPPPAEATAMTQTTPMETSPALPIPSIPGLPALIEKAKSDLSQRSSVPVAQINVLEAREVFWPDASLGCPQPGTTYDQIQVPGYLIRLQANSNEFEYHANIHNHVFYCENPTPPALETPASGPPQ